MAAADEALLSIMDCMSLGGGVSLGDLVLSEELPPPIADDSCSDCGVSLVSVNVTSYACPNCHRLFDPPRESAAEQMPTLHNFAPTLRMGNRQLQSSLDRSAAPANAHSAQNALFREIVTIVRDAKLPIGEEVISEVVMKYSELKEGQVLRSNRKLSLIFALLYQKCLEADKCLDHRKLSSAFGLKHSPLACAVKIIKSESLRDSFNAPAHTKWVNSLFNSLDLAYDPWAPPETGRDVLMARDGKVIEILLLACRGMVTIMHENKLCLNSKPKTQALGCMVTLFRRVRPLLPPIIKARTHEDVVLQRAEIRKNTLLNPCNAIVAWARFFTPHMDAALISLRSLPAGDPGR